MKNILHTLIAALLLLAGCGGGSALSGPNLRVNLTDSPIAGALSVYVTIARVELIQTVDGQEKFVPIAETPQEFDLLTLQNDVFALLAEGTFPAGDYDGLRLVLASSGGVPGNPHNNPPGAGTDYNRIVFARGEFSLKVPSGQQTGIKLHDPFRIRTDELTELTIDFNVLRSVIKLGIQDEYILKPRLTLIQKILSGAIEGQLTSTEAGTPLAGGVVSAQQNGQEVLSTSMRDDGTYRLSPLLPGTYTLVVSAPGFGIATADNIAVTAGVDLRGNDFALAPSDTGSIAGTTLPGDETIEVQLQLGGDFIAASGADAVTGEFAFANVPVGTYDLVLYVDGVETDRITGVEVTADTETGGLELGLD